MTQLGIMDRDGDTKYVYVKYKNQAYRVTVDSDIKNETLVLMTKSVDLVYTPDVEGIEGTTKTYNGEEWTVLYNKGEKVEIVSPNDVGKYTVGANDAAENTGTNINRAISSYNNVVTRLNNYCRTTLADNTARSVGSNPNSPDSSTNKTYSSKRTDNWNTQYNNQGLIGDNNAEQDYVRMCYWGVASYSGEGYWLASRSIYINEFSNEVQFDVQTVTVHNEWISMGGEVWHVDANGAGLMGSGYRCGVRAIVTVNK